MITLKNIKKTYGDRTVLDIENLTFSKGETVAIVGPNGSGKSTLLKIIADTVKSDGGDIERNGKILYLPQQSVPFRKSVRKNILFSMKITLVSISIASLLIVQLIGNGIGVDVKAILTGSVVGQFLLFVTGILYLFVAMKLFVTDK